MSNGEFQDDLFESLQAARRGPRTEDCPEEDRLRFLAVGLTSPSESQELLAHAATCDYCGPLLREAVQDLGAAPSTDEVQFAASTRLANPRRRRAFAKKLAGPQGNQRIPLFFRWAPVGALAGLGVFFIQSYWNPLAVAGRRVNEAYTANRTMAMRFPGAAYSPVKGVEMSGESSRLNQSPKLYEAEAKIQRGLESHPGDPQWLRLRGETDVLENRQDAAINELGRARALRPDDPYILSDLAVAYYQKAQNGDDQYYAKASEAIAEGLALKPKDPVLLFNRALVAGHLQAVNVERDAWQAYLRVEPEGGWAGEARQRLAQISTK